jgi:hypothetical protein
MKIPASLILCLVALAICFISVPILAAIIGGWYAYWGIMAISAVWALILLWLKLTKYWEGED